MKSKILRFHTPIPHQHTIHHLATPIATASLAQVRSKLKKNHEIQNPSIPHATSPTIPHANPAPTHNPPPRNVNRYERSLT